MLDLSDVGLSGPSGSTGPEAFNGDVLQWNATDLLWENEPGLWEDLRVPLSTTSKFANIVSIWGGINAGTNGAGIAVVSWNFSGFTLGSAENSVFFEAQLPHSYLEGTAIEPHVHFIHNGSTVGTTGSVRFFLEYVWANLSGIFNKTATTIYSQPTTINSGDTANIHLISSFGGITGNTATMTISSMLLCRLIRDNTVANNYQGTVGGMEIDFHYQQQGTGSRSQYVKST
jgi:hypothetical protein